MRLAVRLLPEPLHSRTAEEVVSRTHGELAQPAGDRACERLDRRGELLSELGGDVGVRVQLVDEIEREHTTDLVVLEQLGARRHPPVGLESLPLRPDGQRGHEADDSRKHDEHPDGDPAPAREPGRRSRIHLLTLTQPGQAGRRGRLLVIVEAWLVEVSLDGLPEGMFELRNALHDERIWGELDEQPRVGRRRDGLTDWPLLAQFALPKQVVEGVRPRARPVPNQSTNVPKAARVARRSEPRKPSSQAISRHLRASSATPRPTPHSLRTYGVSVCSASRRRSLHACESTVRVLATKPYPHTSRRSSCFPKTCVGAVASRARSPYSFAGKGRSPPPRSRNVWASR